MARRDEDRRSPHGRASESSSTPPAWTIEMWADEDGFCPFAASVARLDPYQQAVLDACVTHVLASLGMTVASTEWGKASGQGLYELRIRRSLHAIRTWGLSDPPPASNAQDREPVLLRVFFTVHGNRVVLLLQAYDKGGDPSDKRADDDGDGTPPPDPGVESLPPLRPWWGPRRRD